jgi:hypothetical protein
MTDVEREDTLHITRRESRTHGRGRVEKRLDLRRIPPPACAIFGRPPPLPPTIEASFFTAFLRRSASTAD